MESHQYYEPNKYYEDFIAVYSRVSTAQQDIQKQILLAESYIHNNRIDLDKVIWLKDDNVSANKLAIEDRPYLQKLRLLIQQKKVKTVIVYSRDRLARNFYEYVAIVKEFYKYGIKVIFTSTKQPPFSPKLSIESLYGIFAQVEGQNISSRRKDTMKQFPSSIFGYKRIGKRKDVKYIPNPEVVNDLKSFFYKVAEAKEADDLFNILMKYKKILKNKRYEDLLKYLENPFYSAHMQTSYGFEVLHHVEPIISLEEHLKIQEVLKKLKDEVFQAITNAKDRGYITPQCMLCKKDMTFKISKLGESSYYICKRGHEEIRITVEQLNEIIQSKLSIIIKHIPVDTIKSFVFSHLSRIEKDYNHEIINLNRKLSSIHSTIVEKYAAKKNIDSLIIESKDIKNKINHFHIELAKIAEARNSVNNLVRAIKQNLEMEIQNYNLYYLCHLFLEKVEIGPDTFIYHVPFGEFLKVGEPYALYA
ncbi:hypothetical protein BpJC7_26850 [Weizmannia acidilactici]|uniref:Resolvase/invertase-type recombinase catalytic domain-containing protein n=1 Tax=Weizmannia acidilactici TaxID=2607726 RepID=A0A5J4J932_9BACI|nr:recombinase family protein [Weizmannia acidilactici]GER71382.1 hypothetical protein BpJC7_26850 [Weizmannia acidilactici]